MELEPSVTLRVVYIMGTSYCGSTLVNSVLARHTEVLALNELSKLATEVRAPFEDNPRHPLRQPLWQRVEDAFRRRGSSLRDLQLELGWRHQFGWDGRIGAQVDAARVYEDNRRLLEVLAGEANGRWVVDASKGYRRLRMLMALGLEVRVLHLVRAGREVLASARRRHASLGAILSDLQLDFLRSERLRRELSRECFLRVRYPDLVQRFEAVVQSLVRFLDLDLQAEMVAVETPVTYPDAVGAKGYWMLRRGTPRPRCQAPTQARPECQAPPRLHQRDEWAYRLALVPLRDQVLGV